MNTLFRFIQMRPVQKETGATYVSTATESQFHQNMRNVITKDPFSLEDLRSVARNYQSSNDFVHDVRDLLHADQILTLIKRADAITNVDDLAKLTANIFGPNLGKIIANSDFKNTFHRAADTIVSLKVLPLQQDGINSLLDLLRGAGLLRRIAANDPTLAQPNAIRKALNGTVVLPADIFPLPVPPKKCEKVPSKELPLEAKSPNPLEIANNLEYALRELLRVNSADLEAPRQQEESKAQTPISKSGIVFSTKTPLLKAKAIERLSTRTKTTINGIGIDLRTIPWIDVIKRTRHALNTRIAEIDWVTTDYVREDLPYAPDPSPPGAETAVPLPLPHTHGNIRPAGFGDLIVVRQQIKQYEMGEIAHIENVMQSESKKRTHIRREYLETKTLVETEAETERERDQQFTERSEMERETTKTIQEEDSLKTGATISASYGPFIEFTGSVEYETHDATEESSNQASRYAREIVERSAERISERVREERTRIVINEIEETNRHGFDNTSGEGHVTGIYQWVDKIYEVQAFKYDKRLLFDAIVPEPAMFLAHALQEQLPEGVLPPKPREFLYAADQITEVSYRVLAHRYGATVSPPPQDYTTKVKAFKHVSQSSDGSADSYAEAAAITFDGYRALSATIYYGADVDIEELPEERFATSWIGNNYPGLRGDEKELDDQIDEIAVGLTLNKYPAFALTYEITCVPTDRSFDQWQIETHDAIMQAYMDQKTAYEQALEALLAEKGVEILGRNPAENRRLERDELKKFMLTMLTNQNFRSFNAIETATSPGEGYLQPDISRTEEQGPYIRFFEQAFEWVNMMYVLYPYFWGRKDEWLNKLQTEGTDPEHVDFLRAGSARVVLPVRPGFETAVLSFLDTGAISTTLDDVNSPQYLSIIDEIMEHSGETSEQPDPYGEPKEIRLPTSLIKLRETSDLPRWEKQEDDSWQPI